MGSYRGADGLLRKIERHATFHPWPGSKETRKGQSLVHSDLLWALKVVALCLTLMIPGFLSMLLPLNEAQIR